jgi:hypothetical protein
MSGNKNLDTKEDELMNRMNIKFHNELDGLERNALNYNDNNKLDADVGMNVFILCIINTLL